MSISSSLLSPAALSAHSSAAHPFSLVAWRQSLPPPLARLLVYSGSGKSHCLRLATLALELWAARPSAISPTLVLDFLLAAWEADPSESTLAGQILDLATRLAPLPAAKAALLHASAHSQAHAALQHWHQGHKAMQSEDWHTALAHFQDVGGGWLLPLERAGHCLMRLGQRMEALALWREVLKLRPWRTELALTLHDHLQEWDKPLSGPPGPTAVLFYTWNKADDLYAALHSLEASLPDVALVACLDNGSTDATPDVLRSFQNRWGSLLHVHSLPVNVGAAAARNWLAALPEVRALPFAAYVDDDVILSSDWLRHLARAVRLYPEAATWGCRIVDAEDPTFLQSGPLHLWPNFFCDAEDSPPLPAQPDQKTPAQAVGVAFSPLLAKGEPFRLTDFLCAGYDLGHCNFLRPCASITGCCHLFRSASLVEQPFSLAFSPSQLDDVQRDLVQLHAGKSACYTGFGTIKHKKRSGQGALSPAALGNALGNKYKLNGQWSAEEVTAMIQHEHQLLEADLYARLECLEAAAGLCYSEIR